ncbi:MAG: hypothetical protein KAS65_08350 [Candidatus Aminicenantes bacterium]|nr:hypothetical protein [Candidatus Aminicenantes bacterium]
MKNKELKILLVASIALNLAFFSGLGIKKFLNRDKKQETVLNFRIDLDIHQNQKNHLNTIIKQFRLHLIKSKQDILEKRIEIIEELSDPEVDFGVLKTKTQELNKYENQMNNTFVETLININNLLDEKQRLSFLLKLSQNWFFMEETADGK